jgi:hypothetical protein
VKDNYHTRLPESGRWEGPIIIWIFVAVMVILVLCMRCDAASVPGWTPSPFKPVPEMLTPISTAYAWLDEAIYQWTQGNTDDAWCCLETAYWCIVLWSTPS